VVVVSESFARRHFPGDVAVGRSIDVLVAFTGVRRIVGVVRDVRRRLDEPMGAQLYLPFQQPSAQIPLPIRTLVVRSAPGATLAAPLRAELAAMDPGLPLGEVQTMDHLLARSVQQRRLSAALLGMFAALALLLAAAGIYAVMSYTVGQRTREIGVRMALGAQRAKVLGMVLQQTLRLTLLGLILGLAGALATSRLLQSQLYGISATDPGTYAVLAAVLLAVATLASLLPARRATRVDPMIALRQE
jgi:hypothetical protein